MVELSQKQSSRRLQFKVASSFSSFSSLRSASKGREKKLNLASSFSSLSSLRSLSKSSIQKKKKTTIASLFNIDKKEKVNDNVFIEVVHEEQVTEEEVSMFEARLKEIEERKQLEIQNVSDWKNEKKWKLDRKYRARNDAEDNKVQFSVKSTDDKKSVIDKLVQDNEVLRKKLTKLEHKRDKMMAKNTELRKKYDKQSTLIREIRKVQESFEAEKRLKEIFHNTINKVTDLLHSRCNEMELVIDTIVLGNKTKKKYPKQEEKNNDAEKKARMAQAKNEPQERNLKKKLDRVDELHDDTCSMTSFSDSDFSDLNTSGRSNGGHYKMDGNSYECDGIKVSSMAPTAAVRAQGKDNCYCKDGIKVTSRKKRAEYNYYDEVGIRVF